MLYKMTPKERDDSAPAKTTGAPAKNSTAGKFAALCGRIFRDADPSYFPGVRYRGRTIYLCTDSCLGAFLADPDLFYKMHRNSEKNKR